MDENTLTWPEGLRMLLDILPNADEARKLPMLHPLTTLQPLTVLHALTVPHPHTLTVLHPLTGAW